MHACIIHTNMHACMHTHIPDEEEELVAPFVQRTATTSARPGVAGQVVKIAKAFAYHPLYSRHLGKTGVLLRRDADFECWWADFEDPRGAWARVREAEARLAEERRRRAEEMHRRRAAVVADGAAGGGDGAEGAPGAEGGKRADVQEGGGQTTGTQPGEAESQVPLESASEGDGLVRRSDAEEEEEWGGESGASGGASSGRERALESPEGKARRGWAGGSANVLTGIVGQKFSQAKGGRVGAGGEGGGRASVVKGKSVKEKKADALAGQREKEGGSVRPAKVTEELFCCGHNGFHVLAFADDAEEMAGGALGDEDEDGAEAEEDDLTVEVSRGVRAAGRADRNDSAALSKLDQRLKKLKASGALVTPRTDDGFRRRGGDSSPMSLRGGGDAHGGGFSPLRSGSPTKDAFPRAKPSGSKAAHDQGGHGSVMASPLASLL